MSAHPPFPSSASTTRPRASAASSGTKRRNRGTLILHAAATAGTYGRWVERLAGVTAGLRFATPGTWHCAEALSTFSRKRPSDFLLFYPESWRLEEPASASPGPLSACLLNPSRDRAAGRLDLAVVSRGARPDLRPVVDGFLAGLTAAGFEGPPIPFAPIPPPAAVGSVEW